MLKKLGLSLAALVAAIGIAYAGGAFQGFPVVGDTTGTTNCLSAGNNGVCNQYSPAGPADIPAAATVPADTNVQGAGSTANPATVLIPFTSLGAGNTTINTTTGTGQAIVVAAGVSNYVYAGAGTATFATFTFPAAPTQNQMLCLVNAGSGVLTLTSLVATGQTITGVTPTSIPVQTAVGTAGTVTLGTNCWLYNKPALTWYRVL